MMRLYSVQLTTFETPTRRYLYVVRANKQDQAVRCALESLREDGISSPIQDSKVYCIRANGPRVLFLASY